MTSRVLHLDHSLNPGFDDILVGAPHFESAPEHVNEGKVYLFLGSESGLRNEPEWTYECNLSNASCGYAVDTAGDVNGDDYDDIIIGASHYDNQEINEGAALVFYGSVDGPTDWVNWITEIDQDEAWFGVSVASAGDVNGDTYDDVIVGSSKFDPGVGQTDFGAAFVYMGSPSGPSLSFDWAAYGIEEYSGFGRSVRSAGDVNQDGYADVLIGAYQFGQNGGDFQPNEGAVYLYLGSAFGLQSETNWWAYGNKAETDFGFSAGPAGDVNGDGGDDVIVGAPIYKFDEKTVSGRAFVYLNTFAGDQDNEIYIPMVIGP